MKVSLGTIEIGDYGRRAIRHHYGRSGLATRDEVRRFAESAFEGNLDDVICMLQVEEEAVSR